MTWSLVDKVSVDLAGVTLFCVGNGVKEHFELVIPHSSNSITELWTGLVGSTGAIVGVTPQAR